MKKKTPEERFLTFIKKTKGGCWLWLGGSDKLGYGRFYADGRTHTAHRWSYKFYIKEIPKGLELHHKCEIKSCVNPKHLKLVTRSVNMLLLFRKNTYCANGHPFNEKNTSYNNRGHRICKACYKKNNSRNKLDEKSVIQIINKLNAGVKGCELAKQYGVTAANISSIKNNKTWNHVVR